MSQDGTLRGDGTRVESEREREIEKEDNQSTKEKVLDQIKSLGEFI